MIDLGNGTLTCGNLILSGGLLTGAGTVTGDFSNQGTIEVGGQSATGQITIDGNYVQTSSGSLNIEIAGTTAFQQYDVLTVTGQATLAGMLNIALLGGFTPSAQNGDTFAVITYETLAACAGFAPLGGADWGGADYLVPWYLDNSLLLVATARNP